MLVKFEKMQEHVVENMKNGNGSVIMRKYEDEYNKIIKIIIPPKSSIGMHTHANDCEIKYVISGQGEAICEGKKELLTSGVCHYCPLGSNHAIINTGDEDLVLFAVVTRLK